MTDVENKKTNKRKSVAKDGKAGSPKKPKFEKNTPQKLTAPKTPKGGKSPNIPNADQKNGQKNKKNKQQADGSPKVKPFPGTGEAKSQTPKAAQSDKKTSPKKKKGLFADIISLVKGKSPDALKEIENRITSFQSRAEMTKTSKRKLRLLLRLKSVAEGKMDLESRGNKTEKVNAKPKQAKKQEIKKEVKKPQPKANKNVKVQPEPELEADDSDDDEEEEVDEEEDDDEGSGEEDGSEEENSDNGEEEESDDDEEEEEEPAPAPAPTPKKVKLDADKQQKQKKTIKPEQTQNKNPNMEELKSTNLLQKNQKRFVLFVGNIAYDTTKQELGDHFSSCGEIKDIRIPGDKSKPRGFAYIEVSNEDAYQRCLSKHHSILKQRKINVLYTQGGKKKGEESKKHIKAKNLKLHALRKQGKLAGSVKETNKRSFRRAKKNAFDKAQASE